MLRQPFPMSEIWMQMLWNRINTVVENGDVDERKTVLLLSVNVPCCSKVLTLQLQSLIL